MWKKQPPELFCKKGFIKNFDKVTGIMSVTVLKERLGHRCFRRPFFVEHFLVTASVQDKELAKDK